MSEDVIIIEENDDKTITTIKLNRLDKKNAFNYEAIELGSVFFLVWFVWDVGVFNACHCASHLWFVVG